MTRSIVLVFPLCLIALACGQKPDNIDGGAPDQDAGCQLDGGDSFFRGDYLDGGSSGPSVEFEQQCARAPNPLRTGLAVGGFCTLAERCAQHACDCSSGTKRYAARGCGNGVCVDKATSCDWAVQYEPRLCQ